MHCTPAVGRRRYYDMRTCPKDLGGASVDFGFLTPGRYQVPGKGGSDGRV